MTKEERLTELARLINKLRNECLMGDRYLPMGDVRRYNQLVYELYGDELGEDPEILEALSKMEKTTRWIPVTERLPKENGRYLVRYVRDIDLEDGVHSDEVRIMRFADAQWRFPFICNPDVRELVTMEKVTHWMPLPEPPKEEQI